MNKTAAFFSLHTFWLILLSSAWSGVIMAKQRSPARSGDLSLEIFAQTSGFLISARRYQPLGLARNFGITAVTQVYRRGRRRCWYLEQCLGLLSKFSRARGPVYNR